MLPQISQPKAISKIQPTETENTQNKSPPPPGLLNQFTTSFKENLNLLKTWVKENPGKTFMIGLIAAGLSVSGIGLVCAVAAIGAAAVAAGLFLGGLGGAFVGVAGLTFVEVFNSDKPNNPTETAASEPYEVIFDKGDRSQPPAPPKKDELEIRASGSLELGGAMATFNMCTIL